MNISPVRLQPRFYLVWCEDGFPPKFRHETFTSATEEAQRLAKANPDKKFIVMAALIDFKCDSILSQTIYETESDLPF